MVTENEMSVELRGLTFWRPWTEAMLALGKDVENRPVAPPRALPGTLIALHTGQRYDAAGAATIYRLTGVRLGPDAVRAGAIVGVMRLTGHVEASSSPWFTGPFGLTFEGLRRVEPVVFAPKFALGWWRVPRDVAAVVLARYVAAGGAL